MVAGVAVAEPDDILCRELSCTVSFPHADSAVIMAQVPRALEESVDVLYR